MSTAPARPTLLVLGAGGNVSQGILKALRAGSLDARVVAACVSPLGAGLHVADHAYVSPYADDAGFLPWVEDVVAREGVQGILSGVEEVLAALAADAEGLRERTGAVVVAAAPDKLGVGADKLVTARWLEEHGLPFAPSAAGDDSEGLDALTAGAGFPLVVKPRAGKGGEGVAVLADERALDLVRGDPTLVVQEHLGDEHGEFTAGCVCDREGRVAGTTTMWRSLQAGTTYRARVVEHPEVAEVAREVVGTLAPAGPCNVQMRMTDRGPVPFELNVRFSGTTPMRVRLGFDEVGAVVRHLVLGEPMPDPGRARDAWVMRYWNEVYAEPDAVQELEQGGERTGGDPALEDWGMRP